MFLFAQSGALWGVSNFAIFITYKREDGNDFAVIQLCVDGMRELFNLHSLLFYHLRLFTHPPQYLSFICTELSHLCTKRLPISCRADKADLILP